jgi:lipopolysaccharide cholinephosphotransferase
MSFGDQKMALENMVIARDVLEERGVALFLNFGTLLGAIREKNFIPHDHDVDMGIFEKDRPAFMSAIPELQSRGFAASTELTAQCRMVTVMRGGEQLDFFFAQPHRTLGLRRWDLDSFALVPARHLDSLDEIDFLGERFKVPHECEGFIRRLYGKTWRIPIDGKMARTALGVRFAAAFRSPWKTLLSIPVFLRKRLGWSAQARRNKGMDEW